VVVFVAVGLDFVVVAVTAPASILGDTDLRVTGETGMAGF